LTGYVTVRRQFGLTRHAQLSHDDHVEGSAERIGHFLIQGGDIEQRQIRLRAPDRRAQLRQYL